MVFPKFLTLEPKVEQDVGKSSINSWNNTEDSKNELFAISSFSETLKYLGREKEFWLKWFQVKLNNH